MIVLKNDMSLKEQLQNDIQELGNYKNTYMQKIYEYKEGTNYINSLLKEQQCTQMTDTLLNNSEQIIKIYNTQVSKIERNLEVLNEMLENIDNLNKDELIKNVKKYNKKYTEIKRNIVMNTSNFEQNLESKFLQPIQENCNASKETKEETVNNIMDNVQTNQETLNKMNNSITNTDKINDMKNDIVSQQENTMDNIKNIKCDNSSNIEKLNNINKIQNNDILLISEILNAVVLPYTVDEVVEIFENDNGTYKTVEDVIIDKFTRPLSDYRFQFLSRYNETIKLLTVRQDYKLGESIPLALEIMGKRYLHPAIISACRSLDELDVYLDCLEKNEIDDFKIFKIKYELHPILVKNNGKDKKNSVLKLFSMKPKRKEI